MKSERFLEASLNVAMSDTYWPELAGTLFEEAGDGLFLFDPDTEQLREVNPMAQRLTGFSRRELREMKVTYLFRAEVSGGLNRLRQAFRRTGLFHSQEGFWLRHKAGNWVPVNLTVTRLHTEPKTGGLITARDITERRQAETALRESEARHRLLLEQVPAVVWTTDADLRFTSGAGAGLATLGQTPDQNLGMTLYNYFQTRDPGFLPIVAHRQALAGEPRAYEMEWQSRTWQAHVEPLHDSAGRTIGVIGVALDITERKRAEEGLRTSEAKHRSLVENLTQSVFLKDRNLHYIAVNGPFCRSVGCHSEAEVLGKTDFDLYPQLLAEKYRTADRLVLQEGRRLELEEQNLIGGKLRTVQKVKTPVRDEKDNIVGVLGIFWDVTDQRNLEAQLRQAHKMEAVGQLAGGIAHDFNNLLTGILGNLSLAIADLPMDHPNRELLTSAEVAALRAAELTRQMLGFSRRAPLRPEPLDLNAAIEETVRLLRRTFDPRIRVEVRAASELWKVEADAGQIGQVLMNLCLNARDAMPQGGTLTLETANVVLDAVAARGSIEGRPGEFAHLRVRDTGLGIPPEALEHIFEPFFTTKEPGKGTGLGLAMVFGIVKQHRGWIQCASGMGEGTVFDIYLPRLPIVVAGPTAAPPLAGIRGGRETILLADDEEVVGRLGLTILERHGYRVLNAMDGAEAVEIYRCRHAEIDLVILDLAMPRLSGAEALSELRRINPTVRVLISSGYSSDEDLRAVERAGVHGFVAKPYRPADLARKVRAALDEKPLL